MLNYFIRFSLCHRGLVLATSMLLSVYGLFTVSRLPVDVFPDLNRPTVTVMIEAPGLAPEEVETQVTFPLETAMNGAPGVERVRSSSGIGLSVIWVEFGWDTDIWHDRQVVQERINQSQEKLPSGVTPFMAPISSIMGEIMLVGLYSETLDPIEVRTAADWVIRPRLLAISGIAQVTVMGGGVKQYQVLADPERMRRYGITFKELEEAISESNENSGGGFIYEQSQEFMVRNLGRIRSLQEIENSLVVTRDNVAVRVRDIAEVRTAPGIKRGEGSVNGKAAVIIALQKQPGTDTRQLTEAVDQALEGLRSSLPKDLKIEPNLFRQAHFIKSAIDNVQSSLFEGIILVSIIILLFLMNLRTAVVTLTAFPLSLLLTALVFKFFGMSINTMTLGGIAVAVGELVDDAIVDMENVFRRLRENRHSATQKPVLEVIFLASSEIRNSIVFSTILVMLVFFPLFALSGIEGRLFTPLAVAYIVSILISLVVSLTVTPVLCSYLLPGMKSMEEAKDGLLLRACKAAALFFYRITFPYPKVVIGIALALLFTGIVAVTQTGTEFLPPFNEGTATINLAAQPGISLEESNRLGALSEHLILEVPEVKSTGRRTGRAEQDEHAEGVHYSEIDVDFFTKSETDQPDAHKTAEGRRPPAALRPRPAVLADIRKKLEELPGLQVNVGQPISHRIDHLLSGVRAQVAVKISGPDLGVLRRKALEVERAMKGIPGVVDLQVEPQVLIPQLRLRVKRDAATRYGFKAGNLTETFETALNGKVLSQVIDGTRFYDLLLWTPESVRDNFLAIASLRLVSPSGAVVLLSDVADVVEAPGPNQINREDVARRIAVFCNVQGRDLGSTVKDIQQSIAMDVLAGLPEGYSITYGGQFESQQRATRLLLILSAISLLAMFALLYAHFHSAWLVIQVMLNVPFAFIGGVAALLIAGEPFSVASLVGFISLTGVSSRNGIMMLSHYLHLMTEEGMTFGRDLVIKGSQERVAPVLMTALTTILGLIPLVLAASGQPGKEILYPVGVVVLGGIITSTLLDFAITPTIFFNYSGKAAVKVAAAILSAKESEKSPNGNLRECNTNVGGEESPSTQAAAPGPGRNT